MKELKELCKTGKDTNIILLRLVKILITTNIINAITIICLVLVLLK